VAIEQTGIGDNELILPKQVLKKLKRKFPFYRIPKLKEYNHKIIVFSKENNQLPYYSKFDINNDGKDEIMLIHRSIIGGYGRLLIISEQDGKYKFDRIKWKRPVNSLFFDYRIEVAEPRKYQTFRPSMKSKKIKVDYPHIITKGYISRIVYWDGLIYRQEKI